MTASPQLTTVQQLQSRFGAAIDGEIAAWLTRAGELHLFYGMMQYQLGYVDGDLEPTEGSGGKRFRPSACLLACEAVGGRWEEALTTAACVEMLHNFSLVHDDIEDGDPVRRHRPTVWKVWGERQAINAGDGMFAVAGRAILEAAGDPDLSREVARGFQEMALTLTEGQYLDMSFETRSTITSAEYLDMIERKSAAIIAFALWAGAKVGGGTDTTCAALRSFGIELGKAFQIRDDVMGIWADPALTGKETVKDLRNRKKTLPVLVALENATGEDRQRLSAYLARENEDVAVALRVLERTQAEERCRRRTQELVDSAVSALDLARISDEARSAFSSLARELGLVDSH